MTALEAWVARLRSGHVKQITGQLGDEKGGRCCLGVACDIGVEYGVVPPPVVQEKLVSKGTMLSYDDNAGFLPNKVRAFIGLTSAAGTYQDADGNYRSLQEDNDDRRLTFKQIADIIESKPKGLFVDPPTV